MGLTHFMRIADKRFLGSWDLCTGEDDKGNPVYGKYVGTISAITKEKVFEPNSNAEKVVTVCRFKELKPMILNKTNLKAIEKALKTPFVEKWTGKRIVIAVKKVKLRGEYVDALRIEETAPKEEKKYTCNTCGTAVSEDIARRSFKKFGVVLCAKCGKEKLDAEQDSSAGEADERAGDNDNK